MKKMFVFVVLLDVPTLDDFMHSSKGCLHATELSMQLWQMHSQSQSLPSTYNSCVVWVCFFLLAKPSHMNGTLNLIEDLCERPHPLPQ